MSNKGTGPALIDTWKISIGNERVGEFTNGWINVLNRIESINKPWVNWGAFGVLQAGESRPIFFVKQAEWKELSPQDKASFNNALRLIKLEIKYRSIYGEDDRVYGEGNREIK